MIEALVIARAHVTKRPLRSASALVKPLARFGPPDRTPAQWEATLVETATALVERGVLTADFRLGTGTLAEHIGRHGAKTWAQLADKILPALALGVAADDTKTHARLAGRDAWAAAIAGRALGVWTSGPPPALGPLCDALAWRELDLPGTPKRCPPEVRAVFVQRRLASDPGPPERLVRLLAATTVGAPRPELRALLDALVRTWLAGKLIGAPGPRTDGSASRDGLVGDVLTVAGSAERFGDRKVFISSVWDQLRRRPRWAGLALADFKAQLVAAHRSGELVLARADLVAAMDPALVAASETLADGASFHFILRETPA